MASMREIKRRKESIASTEQITKAMKLVATVKLQKARNRAENGKPYMRYMSEAVRSILARSGSLTHPYLRTPVEGKSAVLLITSNRGLAGGYNMNAVRLVEKSGFTKDNTVLYTIGKKGHDALKAKGFEIARDESDVINAPMYQDAIEIGETLLAAFREGTVSSIYLVYTEFRNTVQHDPKIVRLLPVEEIEEPEEARTPMNFDPDDESVLDSIIPQYMTSLIYGAMLECVASENGARMTAMDSATDNCEEMINALSMQFNHARQGAITQELTEIIAGSGAY